ncbi:hypothetical protein EVAR_80030_1 [Eumeta japonica]|uniref:Uncharacterized protein n=1 Tax=Eumeta variegata TaxID=151549 RepID=A0A4C1WP84_EUMVA|nr:hypothetical protein EVAR_80030_1 [Eumeta japonica]
MRRNGILFYGRCVVFVTRYSTAAKRVAAHRAADELLQSTTDDRAHSRLAAPAPRHPFTRVHIVRASRSAECGRTSRWQPCVMPSCAVSGRLQHRVLSPNGGCETCCINAIRLNPCCACGGSGPRSERVRKSGQPSERRGRALLRHTLLVQLIYKLRNQNPIAAADVALQPRRRRDLIRSSCVGKPKRTRGRARARCCSTDNAQKMQLQVHFSTRSTNYYG